MSEKNLELLKRAITTALEPRGFKWKASAWYLDGQDGICVVELQKSNFGEQYYVNLAISVKELDPNPFPKEHQCHVRGRLSEVVADKPRLEAALNFDTDASSPSDRFSFIVDAIVDEALPLLSGYQNLESLKEALEANKLKKFLVSLKLKRLLGLPDS